MPYWPKGPTGASAVSFCGRVSCEFPLGPTLPSDTWEKRRHRRSAMRNTISFRRVVVQSSVVWTRWGRRPPHAAAVTPGDGAEPPRRVGPDSLPVKTIRSCCYSCVYIYIYIYIYIYVLHYITIPYNTIYSRTPSSNMYRSISIHVYLHTHTHTHIAQRSLGVAQSVNLWYANIMHEPTVDAQAGQSPEGETGGGWPTASFRPDADGSLVDRTASRMPSEAT